MTFPSATPSHGLPKPGDLLAGKYRVEKLLGMGGMGAVYGANHELLSQRVAIKVLLAEIASNQEAVSRFLNEARASAKIQNEHCARVMDVGTLEAGQPYMVMEYLEGCDLSQLLERYGPLAVMNAVDFVLQALEALAHAHALNLVHRDLKPANLFLARQQDGSDIVKVLDFGISKATNGPGAASPSLTSTKALLGSPLYMSPEQLRSSKNVDPRTDIWALGIILYELLTGRTPYDGDNVGELFAAILEKDAPPVRSIRPDVPAGLDQAVLRCLCRDPNQRFSDVGQLAEALGPFASQEGVTSVDRVRRSIATLRGGPGAPVAQGARISGSGVRASGSISGGVPANQTASSWGDAGAPKKGMGAGPLVGIAFLLFGLGIGAVVFFMHSRAPTPVVASASPPPSAPPSAASPAESAPTTSAAPPATASADPDPAMSPSASPSASPPSRAVASAPPVAQPPHAGATAAPKPAKPPRSAAPTTAPTGYDPTKDPSAQ